MEVYHGSTTWKVGSLAAGIQVKLGRLYVTDSPERAARYANSQADEAVTRHTFPLREHAVVLTIETSETPRWLRRPENHGSLDQCEATISQGRVVAADIVECKYWNCTCHGQVARFRQILNI